MSNQEKPMTRAEIEELIKRLIKESQAESTRSLLAALARQRLTK